MLRRIDDTPIALMDGIFRWTCRFDIARSTNFDTEYRQQIQTFTIESKYGEQEIWYRLAWHVICHMIVVRAYRD